MKKAIEELKETEKLLNQEYLKVEKIEKSVMQLSNTYVTVSLNGQEDVTLDLKYVIRLMKYQKGLGIKSVLAQIKKLESIQ